MDSKSDYTSISPSCYWKDVYNNDQRNLHYVVYFGTCVVSALAMTLLTIALRKSNLRQDDSYRYLTLFTVPAATRRFLLVLSSVFNQTIMSTCVFFAYIDSLFIMLEIEGLTHACISRFVIARYAAKGWPMNRNYWLYFIFSTIAFAMFYTFIPLTGYGGSYDYDFTCTSCSYNMILPDTPERYFIVLLFIMRYVKPPLVMVNMLLRASHLEEYICRDGVARNKVNLMMVEVHGAFLICCTMLITTRLTIITDQLLAQLCGYEDTRTSFIKYLGNVEISYWLYELWPIGALVVMMFRDKKIRRNTIDVWKRMMPAKWKEREEKATAEKHEYNEKE